MPTPEFILELRRHVGHTLLWLTGATAVIVRERDSHGERVEEVLLVQRSDDQTWTPVTGIVDPGEEPHVTAVREAFEEASIVAEVDRLCWVSVTDVSVYENGDRSQYLDHTFLCRWVSGDPTPGDDENLDARWYAVDALPEMPEHMRDRVHAALSRPGTPYLGRDAFPPGTSPHAAGSDRD